MKLVRFGPAGREKPGIIDSQGRIRDLSGVVPDIAGEVLGPRGLAKIRKANVDKLPVVRKGARLGACVGSVGNFIAIGLNYADHAAESGVAVPSEPVVFNKAPSCVCGPNDNTIIPKDSTKLDWEIELGVVIGTAARYVDEEAALSHVAGYCIVNDVSERSFQMATSQWDKGKGFDTAGPIGPWLVTTDEITDPQALDMRLEVNGKSMQTGSTRTMVFNVAKLISHVSQYMSLLPGDVIATGTPPGVGLGMKPPVFLKPGDVMRLTIQGLGEQKQRVVAYSA
jgi:2-keto-4-pentenoate hydratase/2-oxohepta-3-ene-1,7-dioic acid hydratase in catechol pathway